MEHQTAVLKERAVEVNLCICNKCNGVFIDTNPQVGADMFYIERGTFNKLVHHKCPVCKTNDYLEDL